MKTLNGIGVKLQASRRFSGRVQMGSAGTAPPRALCVFALFAFVFLAGSAETQMAAKKTGVVRRSHPLSLRRTRTGR